MRMKSFYLIKIKSLTLAIIFFIQTLSAQTVLRVNVNTPCTSGCDGSTWAKAYPNVSNALSAFSSGELWVAAGTYKPGTDRLNSFDLKNNAALYGGFNGTETARSDRDVTTNLTILSGDMNGNDVGMTNNGENNYHVVTSYAKTGIVMDGFTIKGGNANVSATNDGGGFYCVEGQATVRNCIFEYNYAEYGGAFDASISPSSSVSTTLNVTITDCTFRNNQGGWGPTLAFHAYIGITTATVENCLFESNSGSYGGAIWESNGGTGKVGNMNNLFKNCTFKTNSATYGGALECVNAVGSTLQNTLTNCQFSNNSSSYGGAVKLAGANTFTNCLFSKNNGTYGGAVDGGADATFTNCTFSSNTGTYGTCFRDAAATTTLTNCILWNQTTPIDNASAVVNYCDVQGGWSTGTGNRNVDPQFTSVASDNYRLAIASPCRNVGNNAANAETTDLEGYQRIVGGTIDLGAYEGPSNSIGILVTDAAFATAIRSVCATCIDGLNYLTTVAASQTSLNVSNKSINDLTGIEGFSSLTTLNVSNNNLSTLPALPNTVTNLTLSTNTLTDLPNLPTNLTQLRIDNNSITCLTTLPNSLSTFVYDAADILCIPNKPTALTTTLPICGLITANPLAKVTSACATNVNLTATATASSAMTVKWQRKRTTDMDYSDVAAATSYTSNTTATYTFMPIASDNGAYYRAVFTPTCMGTATSATQILTADALAASTYNNSLNFDGTNDYLEVTNCSGAAFPFTDAITIEYWFKGSNTQSAVRFQPDANTYIVAGWNNSQHIISTSGGTNGVAIGSTATDGNWHHLAMTWQKNTSFGFVSYLDGVRVERQNSTNVTLPSMTSGLFIGSYNGNSEFMNGSIDEIRIWNVVRTQTQIQTNKCNLSLPQTGLVMYYKFNQGFADGSNVGGGVSNAVQAGVYTGVLNNFNLSGASSNFSSNVPATCGTVLPVELLDFNGKNTEGGNVLTWATTHETNAQFFDIQRLNKPNEFETIGQVSTEGKAATYSFVDNKSLIDVHYYRLKMVDFDGKSVFSKTISVQKDKIGQGVNVYPNPANDKLFIHSKTTDNRLYTISNLLGQVVQQGEYSINEGINIASLPTGVYQINASNTLVKFIKQ